jgi:hypothetical protein
MAELSILGTMAFLFIVPPLVVAILYFLVTYLKYKKN